jgi:hypothetical protein
LRNTRRVRATQVEFGPFEGGMRFAFGQRIMAETQAHAHSTKAGALKSRLLDDHHALRELLIQLNCALEAGDPSDIGEVWAQFERNLRDHLDNEERCLFPLVASAHRREVEGLRLQHQHIRCALGELGMLVELHALRKASVDELIQYLIEHASSEEHSLYEWLDDSALAPAGLLSMFARGQKGRR